MVSAEGRRVGLHVSYEFSSHGVVHDADRKLRQHERDPDDADEYGEDELYVEVFDLDVVGEEGIHELQEQDHGNEHGNDGVVLEAPAQAIAESRNKFHAQHPIVNCSGRSNVKALGPCSKQDNNK